MRTHVLGEGRPELAVVVGQHGDEPCGERAMERLLADESLRLSGAVLFVVANERARDAGERFVDVDLNRAYPGDPDADAHEARLASRLLEVVDGLPVLDLHSTVSTAEPFALYQRLTPRTRRLLEWTGLDRAVDVRTEAGGLASHVDGVAVECGRKGSEAAVDTAERVLRNVLAAAGLTAVGDGELAGERAGTVDPTVFEVFDRVDGRGYEFLGENFHEVPAGTAFARRGDEELVADEPFYPVLMSTDGYEASVGFRARRLGPLSSLPDDDRLR
ncbi:succinylglutamate desuccinylase [Halorubellus sp. JP-L1]|uniref:succinylglutamate desuccinylase/aspartoacylase domain-containing protein n=1 Tax=Halorubellus sp. JP-L1 TaxID=2715753 RepID=UPI00140B2204|nr:succinylglutamate desuccinylase/aspartoacylase family protein [Halorubellus sp. JP-L1]NHN41434.1 succinylglutamate desuccinylase [Halorubellus sp. JP-L1]